MPNENAISVADAYWAEFFGLAREELFSEPFLLTSHQGELRGYNGVYGLFRHRGVMISAPAERLDEVRSLLAVEAPVDMPERMAAALASVARLVVGPAWIGYAEKINTAPGLECRALTERDSTALEALHAACDRTEWEHGSSEIIQTCTGAFADGKLVALAGYEVWGGTIAHISIVTHPAYRGRGYGTNAVAHVAEQALASGLLPQYRTLVTNEVSMKVGRKLGFEEYAMSLAARL